MVQILLILLISTGHLLVNAQQMVALKVECEWDENLLTNASCSMTPRTEGGALMNIQGTFVKDANHFWVYHANYEKKGRNYKPGIFKANIDICDFNNAFKGTFFNKFVDQMMTNTRHLIHPCPYTGTLVIKDYVFDGSAFYAKFLRPATYRFDYWAHDENNRTYLYLKYYAVIRK